MAAGDSSLNKRRRARLAAIRAENKAHGNDAGLARDGVALAAPPGARVALKEACEELSAVLAGRIEPSAALELSSGDAGPLSRFALALVEKNDLEAALDAARVALAADPNHALANAVMGSLLARRKEYGAALVHYEKAQTAEPERVRSWVDSGEVRLALGQFEHAAKDFSQALTLDPELKSAAARRAASLVAKTLLALGS